MDTDREFSPDEGRIIVSRSFDGILDVLPPAAHAAMADAMALARQLQPLLAVPTPPAQAARGALDAAGSDYRAFVLGGGATAGISRNAPPEVIALNLSLLLTDPLGHYVAFAVSQAAVYGYLVGSGQLEAAVAEHGGYAPPSPLDDLVMHNGDPVQRA